MLRRAIDTWRGARRHFVVRLAPGEVAQAVRARLDRLPAEERRYWAGVMDSAGVAAGDSLEFLALSLYSAGAPIRVVNTDPATAIFLDDDPASLPEGGLEPFVRRYPVALFVPRLGPLAANDAYADRRVWERFRKDAYHSPTVVRGREVNLLLLGLAQKIAAAERAGAAADPALREALERVNAAVDASGMGHNELWSYRIEGGRLLPTRYGTGSDVQLWNTTDLAVEFALSRLPRR